MGRLIKNHWARLITITAASYQIVAAFESFFWPKIFWDFLTKSLDAGIKPVPVLQIINLVLGFVMLAWEWPIGFLAGSSIHRSLEARLAALPLFALCALLIYQGTNAGVYYLVAMVIYFWAYSEGEIICAKPWTLPQRNRGGGSKA
ncbi:pro41 protein [Apiospora hydei]|uniref:Pro41 protein n=1 Tax=Apiospora hydei TaxID=1337664 RepID=A0ABR1X305_9PEZI